MCHRQVGFRFLVCLSLSKNYPPTLFEWAGGMPAFERLTDILYTRVEEEPLLASLFAGASPQHRAQVAHFIAEVFGGPKLYSQDKGGPYIEASD